ncbi:hypothetical protein CC80DRAFT_550639 [Byssothecium circinans]|uniref:Uncharacterized protein n=1 Tax=Byssothecium circinans TaxID=147558 RepID=A0A6A5TNF3_9PLEO|nr:hypothetical protein CC80DRAFT_550639 [Byssothecium circinans]
MSQPQVITCSALDKTTLQTQRRPIAKIPKKSYSGALCEEAKATTANAKEYGALPLTDLWKGCTCNDDPDWNINPPALNRPDYPAHQKAIKEHGSLKDDMPTPGPTEPVKQNKLLGILADWKKDPRSLKDFSKVNWLFFATDIGTEVGCRQDWLTSREDTVDILYDADHTFYPGGTFELQMPGFNEKCEYKNDGGTTGRLFCPGQEISCVDDPHDKNPSDLNADKGNYECGDKIRQPVFICEY